MIIIAILISLAGIAALCWLLFNLAVFALPFFAGIAAGTWAHETDAGIPGAIAAALTFGPSQGERSNRPTAPAGLRGI